MNKVLVLIILCGLMSCASNNPVQIYDIKLLGEYPVTPKIKSNIEIAKPKHIYEPLFPSEAKANGISGWVHFEFRINTYGSANEVKIRNSYPEGIFEDEAKRAFKYWKFYNQGHSMNQRFAYFVEFIADE